MTAPLIGISTYAQDEKQHFTLPREYVDCVRAAGGLPLLLPPGETDMDRLFDLLDGLILAGGGDIEPDCYGGCDHETVYNTDRERDEMEIALARRAVESDIPTLGICRGTQVLNVALGGTLIEHLPDVVGEDVIHRLPPREPTEHAVTVVRESRLAMLLGETEFVAASWHHQALRDVAKGLAVVAHAPDGTIEAVESSDHRWLFGVQWHPELTARNAPVQQRLFDRFIEAVIDARRS